MSNEYAGGANTNVNGKAFESAKDLEKHLLRMGFKKKDIRTKIWSQHGFISFLDHSGVDWHDHWSKKYLPDDAFIDTERGVARIFEKKYQHSAGSADEKIQTGPFKLARYKAVLEPLGITDVKYAYILSSMFTASRYDDVRDYYADNDEIDLFYEFPDADYFGL